MSSQLHPVTLSGTTCESWAVRECGVELGTHDGLVECARGTQICDSGHWGYCLVDASKKTTSVKAPTAVSGRFSERTPAGLLSIGGSSTTCKDNPCNPYCQVFNDVPDAAIRADGSTVTLGDAAPGPSLANSNVPNGIGNKGDDPNGVCKPGCTSQACQQACQYDMQCSPTTAGKCVPWAVGASGSCVGVDVTAPTTCSVATGRNVTVCNRGTVEAPAGIKCYLFPGNSQHMPEATPDVGGATLIMTTAGAISPGYCETQTLANSLFDSNGTEELICNPTGTTTVSGSTSGVPSTNQLVIRVRRLDHARKRVRVRHGVRHRHAHQCLGHAVGGAFLCVDERRPRNDRELGLADECLRRRQSEHDRCAEHDRNDLRHDEEPHGGR